MDKKYIINEKINSNNILVITNTGEKLGTFTKEKALDLAKENKLDLVLVSQGDENRPSIVKMIDYKKFIFDQKKKNDKQKALDVKEITISSKINIGDINWQAKKILGWLNENRQVKIIIKNPNKYIERFDVIENIYNKMINVIGQNKIKVVMPLKNQSSSVYCTVIAKN